MLYRESIGKYIFYSNAEGIKKFNEAWDKACREYIIACGGSIDIQEPEVSLPENYAHISARNTFGNRDITRLE